MFEAPEEDQPLKSKNKREKKAEEKASSDSKPDINDLKNKFLKKSKK
jgi:hypothetical protein